MNKIDEANKYYRNAFDLLRIICAMQVLFGHYVEHFRLTTISNAFEWMLIFSQYIPGRGVIIFFVISGYLSVKSVEKSSDFLKYLQKKIKRIYPELIIAFLINTVIIFAIFNVKCNFYEFVIYCVTQCTIFQFYTGEWLRGYGAGTANGALWTISVIIQYYLFSYLLIHYINKTNKKNIIYLYMIAVLISIVGSNSNYILPEIIYKLFTVSLFPYLHIFLIGVICYYYSDHILKKLCNEWKIILFVYLCVRFLILIFINETHINLGVNYDVFSALLLSMLTIGVAYKLGNIRFKNEISYGIYIYHMIFVNVSLEILSIYGWNEFNMVILAAISFGATVITSLLSNAYVNRLG